MDKYISRDAIRNTLYEADAITMKGVAILNQFPAADVAPVKHGRWIEQSPDFDLCGVAYYQCSECGKEQQTPANYCQFCGAKMDGGQNG